MEEQEKEEFGYDQDFPHEEVMDDLNLAFSDLDAPIQRAIKVFDQNYFNAMVDGTLTPSERKELISASYLIAQQIKKSFSHEEDDNTGIVVGVLSGIGLLIAGIFGIQQISKS